MHPVEQVALGSCMPVASVAAATIVGQGFWGCGEGAEGPLVADRGSLFLTRRLNTARLLPEARVVGTDPV